jgi:hypothetical protein
MRPAFRLALDQDEPFIARPGCDDGGPDIAEGVPEGDLVGIVAD